MEQHRAEPGELGLEPADHRIAPTDLGPCRAGVVQGEHPANLVHDRIGVRLTEDRQWITPCAFCVRKAAA